MRADEEMGDAIVGCGVGAMMFLALCALVLLVCALFGCGGEYTLHKSVTMPPAQLGVIEMPESNVPVTVIERVPDGEAVYTVSSEIPSQDGKHRIQDQEVTLYREVAPTPAPTWAPLVPWR